MSILKDNDCLNTMIENMFAKSLTNLLDLVTSQFLNSHFPQVVLRLDHVCGKLRT